MHENIIPDSGGIDDFLNYNNMSFINNKNESRARNASHFSSKNSLADQIGLQRSHRLSKTINNPSPLNIVQEENQNKSLEVILSININFHP